MPSISASEEELASAVEDPSLSEAESSSAVLSLRDDRVARRLLVRSKDFFCSEMESSRE
ncbi:hypothetical protein [Verrucomicrobium spinosum]|uniref:hypothetical protein n=1 Tax=Verrucomicrobium spinosum TaxID=2736 RepID=UPI003CCE304C